MSDEPSNNDRKLGNGVLFALASIASIPILIFCLLTGVFIYGLYLDRQNVSDDIQFNQIYNRNFTAQQDLFIYQWSDTKEYYIDDWDYDAIFPKIEKGTDLKVVKIILSESLLGPSSLRVVVKINDPKFSTINRKGINAGKLLLESLRYPYTKKTALFEPAYLIEKKEANSDQNLGNGTSREKPGPQLPQSYD